MSDSYCDASINELLDRAVRAVNGGDRATATALAERVLAVDNHNSDAEDLLSAPAQYGEIRRLTILFVDLVDSTALSTQVELEIYHTLVARYRKQVLRLIEQFDGHIGETKGDGLLAVFGHPNPHENAVQRAVSAGLEIVRAMTGLSTQAQRRYGVTLDARIGIHRGLVYLDTDQDDVFGLAANLAARVCSLAAPGTVAVSEAVVPLIRDTFELTPCAPAAVKGINGLLAHHVVHGERRHERLHTSVPLVGREHERGLLQTRWRQACDGALPDAGIAFVGEPGIGKTRMVTEASHLAEGAVAPVIELAGSPLHTATGLFPVRTLIERRCGITRLTEGRERLTLLADEITSCAMEPETVLPLLAPVLGIGAEHGYPPVAVEGHVLYGMIQTAVTQYLRAVTGDGPRLVIAEDLHWFDPSTLELLGSLLTHSDGHLLVAITSRDPRAIRAEWPVDVVNLAPLTDAESDALISAMAPTVTVEHRAAVSRRCDGVPFYIEHLVSELVVAGADSAVPEALYEPVFARLHRPDADVIPVLEAAAVLGRAGDTTLLRAVVDDGDGAIDVDGVIAELVSARVLVPIGDTGWRFRHELFREVASELAPPSLRRELHARAAQALIAAAAADVEPDWPVVAGHFERAHRHDDAVTALRRASADARRRGALAEARARLSDAVTLLARCEDGRDRDQREIMIRLERGFLAGASDGSTTGDAPADIERCLQLAGDQLDDDHLFLTLTALVGYYIPRAELYRAHELLDTLAARVGGTLEWSGPAFASSLGTVLWLEGDFTSAEVQLRKALTRSGTADPGDLESAWWIPEDPIAAAHQHLAMNRLLRGDADGANTHLVESASRAASLSYPQNAFNMASMHFLQIWGCLETGRLDQAAVHITQLRQLSEESGLELWRLVGVTQHAIVKGLTALDGGDADASLLRAEKLIMLVDTTRTLGLNVYLTYHDAVIGRLLLAAGAVDRARTRLESALRHSRQTGMRFYDAELMRLRAHTLTDPQQRREALSSAIQVAMHQGATLFELRSRIDSFELLGNGDRAGLADNVDRFEGDAGWPEHQHAERILQ